MEPTIAWIAQGRIRIKSGQAQARTIDSKYGDGIRERAARGAHRHGWKMQGAGERFLSGPALWGHAARDPSQIAIVVTSLCRGNAPGQALYSLEADGMCAVLTLEDFGREELRMWNKNDKRLSQLCVSPTGDLACSATDSFGTAHIAIRLNQDLPKSRRAMRSTRRRAGSRERAAGSCISRQALRATGRASAWTNPILRFISSTWTGAS